MIINIAHKIMATLNREWVSLVKAQPSDKLVSGKRARKRESPPSDAATLSLDGVSLVNEHHSDELVSGKRARKREVPPSDAATLSLDGVSLVNEHHSDELVSGKRTRKRKAPPSVAATLSLEGVSIEKTQHSEKLVSEKRGRKRKAPSSDTDTLSRDGLSLLKEPPSDALAPAHRKKQAKIASRDVELARKRDNVHSISEQVVSQAMSRFKRKFIMEDICCDAEVIAIVNLNDILKRVAFIAGGTLTIERLGKLLEPEVSTLVNETYHYLQMQMQMQKEYSAVLDELCSGESLRDSLYREAYEPAKRLYTEYSGIYLREIKLQIYNQLFRRACDSLFRH
jgi:hypothetical protein